MTTILDQKLIETAWVQGSRIDGEPEVVKASNLSVLVVDDFEQWRRVVCATLRAKLGLHIFEEAADGLEAVPKAADLQPDLVMLDIGLPELTGIEVAREIRRISPKSVQSCRTTLSRELWTCSPPPSPPA